MNFRVIQKSMLLASVAACASFGAPAFAQSSDDDSVNPADIVVTARRVEERLQDVPISITVLSQEQIANNNVTTARDIAAYTPGLSTNNRYGGDNTTWTIRGFTQEQRTTSTVGTYFADVVALRGSGATQGGDGAGPGQLFDLQNIQVLKGPQGTLFGRNSTGGAVLLVPTRPSYDFGGYVEATVGDYDLRRFQGALNVPLGDSFRMRLAVDRNQRDGYLHNAGRIGSGPNGDGTSMGSIDYWAVRFSAIADLSDSVENYTIASYTNSQSSGAGPKVTQCFPSAGGNGVAACNQIAAEAPTGFWTVSNALADALSNTETWQFINTTTWTVNDSLTIKNIFSYGELRGQTNLDLFGLYATTVPLGTETNASQVKPFNTTHYLPGSYTNAESSLVEELQFQGTAMGNRLQWQGGLYLEINNPIGLSGIQSTTFTPCVDINTLNCTPFAGGGGISLGRLSYSAHRNYFRGKAAYFQASYDVTEQLSLTGGIRYTQDTMTSNFQVVDIRLGNPVPTPTDFVNCTNTPTFGAIGSATNPRLPLDQRFGICRQSHRVRTSAPTWLLGIDYKPNEDMLFYAKWSRGYRQGAVASFAADRLQDYQDETVDTYELGTKLNWRGAVPGYFNLAGFYNDFRDQQLQVGLQCVPVSACSQTTAIINAGASRLYGFEVEAGLRPFAGLSLQAAYAYLNTKVTAVSPIAPLVTAAGLPFNDIRPITVGSPIPNAVPHKVTLSANYQLPLPDSVGRFSIGGTWVYTSAYRAVADNATTVVGGISTVGNGILPSSYVLNLNANWENVGGLPLDLSAFVTNVTNEHIFLHVNTQEASGLLSHFIGEPRMFGVRARYSF